MRFVDPGIAVDAWRWVVIHQRIERIQTRFDGLHPARLDIEKRAPNIMAGMLPSRASACPHPRRVETTGIRFGMTLVELLVVISVIVVLMGILIPAVMLVQHRAHAAQAQSTVSAIHQALQNYAAADARHRFPPMVSVADRSLRWDQVGGNANLNLLATAGWEPEMAAMDQGSSPWTLLDPFGMPFQYLVDDDLLGHSGALRPLDLPGWNAAGRRPWAYVWSAGPKHSSDGTGWIYQADAQ